EILAVSRGFVRLTGWRGAEFSHALAHGARRPKLRPGAEEAEAEYRLRKPDGTWLQVKETLRRADRGLALGTLAATTASRPARSIADDAMATILAHELSQPLAVMSLAAENAIEALEAGEGGIPEAIARLRRIAAQAERAQAIAAQLRALGRLEVAVLEPVALGAAVRRALAAVAEAYQQEGIQVELRLPPTLPSIRAQPVLLEQVLVNLLLNARDAMQDSVTRRLVIEGQTLADGVALCLTDNGPGLPPDSDGRLFEAFYTTKAAGRGTGLGLAFCRSVMQCFGGNATLANSDEGGAMARLTFLRAAPAVQAARAGKPVNT
ncbi:MAG TPA: ATP-binding protein, partial [Roseococcus sp.]|nr:ATP-binding protein [Roseococcus sp.]